MNFNTQNVKDKRCLSKKLKHIFTLSLLSAPKSLLVPAKLSGKNYQHSADLVDDSDVHQSTIINTFLRELFSLFLLTGLCLFLFSGNLFAATANLAWNASTSPNVGGYKVSYGTSTGNYTSTIDVGNQTTYALSGLTADTKYYFAAKAYDSTKTTESPYSNEANWTTPVTTTGLTADFTANKTSGAASLAVDFTPVTTGTITSWKWDFPGSYTPSVTNSTAKVTTATYPTAGTYSVSLTVTGSSGSVKTTKSNMITVTTATTSPVANFSSSATSGIAPISIDFTDASTGNITSRSWNFGDGSTSTAQNPSHIYSAAGTYTVSLTVTGSGGSTTNTKNGLISVSSSTVTPPVSESSKIGLVAAYGFEEVSGATVADASGLGNHGTIKEAIRITTGKYGKALQFDGVNDWVTVNNSASLNLSTGMSLEAWVYQQSSMSNTIMVKEGTGFAPYEFYSSEDVDLPVSYFNNGNYQSVFGTNPVPLNQWTHLVSTYDGQYQRLYVNGVEVANSARTSLIQSSSGVLRIGGNSLWGEYFQGYIDEVRIYNRALTPEEVTYNKETPVSTSNPTVFVMGDTNLKPWADYRTQGVAEALQAKAQKSALINNVKVYLDASSTATELVAGFYKDNLGHPGALVAQGKLSTLKNGAWNKVSVPPFTVTAGQTYWIAILGSKGQIGFRDLLGSGTSLMETSVSNTLTSLPATWTGSVFKTNSTMSVTGFGY